VITCATGFPTTVTPIYLNGLVPLFVDSAGYKELNADVGTVLHQLERKDVCGVILAHTLGFPYRADLIRRKCDELGKFFVEDVCDAVGATIDSISAGSFGHASTLSFFPAHHIATGEGGAVCTNDGRLHALINSYRDWGRDCWCAPGEQDTCNKRFGWNLGTLPEGWDHKYTFTNVGYNLRMTEMQAALGNSQIDRLDIFCNKRVGNYLDLRWLLNYMPEHLYIGVKSSVGISPFGLPITVISDAFTKQELVAFLESRKIRTRPVFGGNLTRQPAFRKMYYEQVGGLENSDYIMDRTFWVGVHPALREDQLNYVAESFRDFFREKGLK
jgi:CDP-6-deoxy-D-xylo-4-hexulose-3-dehydrase